MSEENSEEHDELSELSFARDAALAKILGAVIKSVVKANPGAAQDIQNAFRAALLSVEEPHRPTVPRLLDVVAKSAGINPDRL